MSEAASAERSRAKAGKTGRAENEPAGAARRINELQVSAHLMTLETGLFCVFQTPGSPQPDPITALPGVRITPAPGIAGRPEAVNVSTFRDDGWLNGTAALVRVTDGSAQILVTIYQLRGMDAAPRLQVLRLSGEASAPDAVGSAATPAANTQPAGPPPDVMAHIQRSGDVGGKIGEWIGTKGSQLWIEGFGLAPLAGVPATDVEYQAVLGRNWLSPWIEAGKYCGSRGMALPVLGLKLRLKGAAAKAFDCTYSATFVDGSAIGPVNAGETCEAESLAAMESFQIALHPRDPRSAAPKPATAGKADYTAHARQPPAKPPLTKPSAKTRG
jgi:hypothetical protein